MLPKIASKRIYEKKRDIVTTILFLDSVTESGAIDQISAAPKIWISKSASMEHDLD